MTEIEKINNLSEHDFNILKEFIKSCDEIIKLNGMCGELKCTVCPLYHGFGYFTNCTLDFGVNYLLAQNAKKELIRLIGLRKSINDRT